MDSIIELENIDFYYDKGKPSEVRALRNINIEIERGEYVSFFGPSGCGKSTMLYVIAGVEKPTSGKVIVNGEDLMNFSEKEIAIYRQIGIGIVFQGFNLIPSVKVIDNVMLPMAFLGISVEKRKDRAMYLLERLGIAELADRYPSELSGGQQQRVGIARAIANDPPIVLADEPIGNLDSQNANNVLDILREFNEKEKKTIIMVTHEAWSLRDVRRVFYMRDGEIIKTEVKKPEAARKRSSTKDYRNAFPELPTWEIRAKVLAALILRGYAQAEIKRLEYYLAHYFSGKIDKDVFRQVLDRPWAQGGVGLWRAKAKKISDYVEEIAEEEKEMERIYLKLQRNPDAPLAHEIEKIRKWLVEDFDMKLTALQNKRFDEVIGERLRNIITPEHFQKILDLGKDKGGVGLRSRTSMKIAEKFEALLGKEEGLASIG